MQKLALTVATAATILFAGSFGWQAQAQTLQQGASKIHSAAATLIPTKPAACQGWGPYCSPGYVRSCGPYRCWCRPCN
jgi:hypothetical protein